MRSAALALLVVLALAGCDNEVPQASVSPIPSVTASPTTSATPVQVIEPADTIGSWIFTGGTTGDSPIDELGNFTITVADDQVSGGSVCGAFVSRRSDGALYPLEPVWEADASELCQPGPLAIISNLGALSPSRLDGETLELTDATTTLTFAAFEHPGPVASNWLLEKATDAKGKFSLTSTRPLDLRLDVRHHFLVFAGCSSGSGQWAGGLGGFTLDAPSTANASCDEKKLSKLDARYRRALAKINTATITNGKLILTGGAVTLKFVPAAG